MASRPCNHLERESVVRRLGTNRHVYWFCLRCGEEWTVSDEVVDLAAQISSEELLDIHDVLQTQLTIHELTGD